MFISSSHSGVLFCDCVLLSHPAVNISVRVLGIDMQEFLGLVVSQVRSADKWWQITWQKSRCSNFILDLLSRLESEVFLTALSFESCLIAIEAVGLLGHGASLVEVRH